MDIPLTTLKRLCTVYQFLLELEHRGIKNVASSEISNNLLIKSHTVRKDINYLGEIGPSPTGYPVKELISLITQNLGLNKERKTCIIGLGTLGLFIMEYLAQPKISYSLIAGFDANINRLERIKTNLPLYPIYELAEVIKTKEIEIALLTMQTEPSPEIIDSLIQGGIKGILNFTAKTLSITKKHLWIKNINIISELRELHALLELDNL